MPVRFAMPLTVGLLLAGCARDRVTPHWDVDVAVPLVRTTLDLTQLIADTLLTSDPDGMLVLHTRFELLNEGLDTLLSAPDTSMRYDYGSPFAAAVELPPGFMFPVNDDVTRFDLDELELSSLHLRAGSLRMVVENRMRSALEGVFALPGATLDGAPVELRVTLPPATNEGPGRVSISRDLARHHFDLRGPSGADVNSMATRLTYYLPPTGGAVTVHPQDSILCTLTYAGLVPEYARGYFGTRQVDLDPGSTELELFRDIAGSLQLSDATAMLSVRNGFGVDARVRLNGLRALRDGSQVDLDHAITRGPINLDRATDVAQAPVPAVNNFSINSGNSNIVPFLELLPTAVAYNASLTIGPLGNVGLGNDFLYHASKLQASMLVTVPLRIAADDLRLERIIEVDLPGTLERPALREGSLHLHVQNGFPLRLELHLAVVDEQGTVIVELPTAGRMEAGTTLPDGTVSVPRSSTLHVPVSADAMNALHRHGRLRIRAHFDTEPSGMQVPLMAAQRLELALSLTGGYMVNGNAE